MAHKYTDFTKLGGLGLTQDDLEHDRNGVYESIAAFYADGGTSPILLSGAFGAGLSAWLVINKEIIPYVGPGFPPPLMGTLAYYIVVTNSSSPTTYEDGAIYNSVGISKVAGLVVGDTLAPPVGGILMDSFIPFQKIFGDKGRGSWQTISGTAPQFDYTIDFKKNFLTNTLHIKGTVVVKAGFTSTSNYYWSLGTLPVGYRPGNDVPFQALYRYHGTSLKDSTNSDYIAALNGDIRSTGGIGLGIRRPDSSTTTYPVTFNTIIPLD